MCTKCMIPMQGCKHNNNLHESNVTDCAIAPPVTILVPRRAPVYYDGSISSVARECLDDGSLGSRANNVGTASPLALITRCGNRCCIYTHSQYYYNILCLFYEKLKLTACCIQVELVGESCQFHCLVH